MADEKVVVQLDDKQARMWAMLCHLAALGGFIIPFGGNIIGPLVVWLIKKNESPLVDENGKEALNFQISMTIYLAGAFLLSLIGIGLLLLIPLGIANLILVVMACVKVNNGEAYKYPITIRLIK